MNKLMISYGWFSRTCLKPVSVLLMSLLLFLTVMNYFVYSEDNCEAAIENALAGSDDGNTGFPAASPAGPDEKSPDAPVSVNEEFIHKHTHLTDPYWTNYYFNYLISGSEQLHVTHFEIVSPPPDSIS
jgi:hypothetical protein